MIDEAEKKAKPENNAVRSGALQEQYADDWKTLNVKHVGRKPIVTDALDTGAEVIVRTCIIDGNGNLGSSSCVVVPNVRLRKMVDPKTKKERWGFNRGTI
ncbi:MAG: hypothetical protein GY820_38735 [Gammaproteobacteria bacterium]|nr:hypothetical protein [Gammaproteobacteria bacterium]